MQTSGCHFDSWIYFESIQREICFSLLYINAPVGKQLWQKKDLVHFIKNISEKIKELILSHTILRRVWKTWMHPDVELFEDAWPLSDQQFANKIEYAPRWLQFKLQSLYILQATMKPKRIWRPGVSAAKLRSSWNVYSTQVPNARCCLQKIKSHAAQRKLACIHATCSPACKAGNPRLARRAVPRKPLRVICIWARKAYACGFILLSALHFELARVL